MNTIKKQFPAENMIDSLFGQGREKKNLLDIEPGLHNVLGIEAAFTGQPLGMDFLDPASPFHALKNLSARLYHRFIDPYLDLLPAQAAVMDAGCGIGRFTIPLAKRFQRVVALDPSPSSLQACRAHLREEGLGNVELHWADLSLLDDLPPDQFDCVLAMELICYVTNPSEALRRLLRVTKPNGLLLLSVEGRPGSLLVQGAADPPTLMDALQGKPLALEEDRFTIYFDRREFESLLQDAGMAEAVVQGSHYFGEGPFWQSIDDARLDDPNYVECIIQAEQACRADPNIAPLARVFSAAGRKGNS